MREVERYTGSPEVMDGRVKTLHPRVHGGILASRRRTEPDERLGLDPIDLVVVNLYPLRDGGTRRAARGDHREHRHRRPVDGPLGGEEPRARHGARRSGRLRRGARRARTPTARSRRPTRPPRRARRSRTPRPTTRPSATSRPSAAMASAEAFPAVPQPAVRAGVRPALRREPPPGGRLLRRARRPRGHASRARLGRRRRQGALVQQPGRPATPRSTPCASSTRPAAVVVKHTNPCGVADGRERSPRRTATRARPTRSAPSAASSRSTARSTTRRRAVLAETFLECVVAPSFSTPRRSSCCAPRRTCAFARRAPGSPRARGAHLEARRRRPVVQDRDDGGAEVRATRTVDQARAQRRRSSRTSSSPGASAST